MEPLERHLASILEQLLPRQRGVRALIAVSGGVDSMVLLHLLGRVSKTLQLLPTVAHFNHQLRGRQSDADERWVQRASKKLGIKCVTARGDVRKHALAEGVSIEMAARALRHSFLAKTARKLRAHWVILAHHADDQVETFFLNALRGRGGAALGGMLLSSPSPWANGIKLLRPLLQVNKGALIAYAQKMRIRHREDASNRDTSIVRNRIRTHMLQPIAQHFGMDAIRPVLQSMAIIGAEADCIYHLAADWLSSGASRLPFGMLHAAVQRQVVRSQLMSLDIDVTFDLIEKLRESPGTKASAGTVCVVFDAATGQVSRVSGRLPDFQNASLPVDLECSDTAQFASLMFRWKRVHPHTAQRATGPVSGMECFDAHAIGHNIELRHWQPGDRFQPIGMKNPVKLQDLLVNARIPADRRRSLAVAVAEDGRIFWVQGLRISEPFKLTKSTRRVLVWTWEPMG